MPLAAVIIIGVLIWIGFVVGVVRGPSEVERRRHKLAEPCYKGRPCVNRLGVELDGPK
jgi:hypothetical protein